MNAYFAQYKMYADFFSVIATFFLQSRQTKYHYLKSNSSFLTLAPQLSRCTLVYCTYIHTMWLHLSLSSINMAWPSRSYDLVHLICSHFFNFISFKRLTQTLFT